MAVPVIFTKVSFGLFVPDVAPGVIPNTAARVQLKVVPEVKLVGV